MNSLKFTLVTGDEQVSDVTVCYSEWHGVCTRYRRRIVWQPPLSAIAKRRRYPSNVWTLPSSSSVHSATLHTPENKLVEEAHEGEVLKRVAGVLNRLRAQQRRRKPRHGGMVMGGKLQWPRHDYIICRGQDDVIPATSIAKLRISLPKNIPHHGQFPGTGVLGPGVQRLSFHGVIWCKRGHPALLPCTLVVAPLAVLCRCAIAFTWWGMSREYERVSTGACRGGQL